MIIYTVHCTANEAAPVHREIQGFSKFIHYPFRSRLDLFKFQVVDYYALDKPNKYIKDQVIRRPGNAAMWGAGGVSFRPHLSVVIRFLSWTHFGGIKLDANFAGNFEGSVYCLGWS